MTAGTMTAGTNRNATVNPTFADVTNPNKVISIPEPDEIDALIASELNGLSLAEREAVLDDLHGVANGRQQECPEMIAEKLQELQLELKNIRGKVAYEKALFLNPSYVNHPKTLLMFLRREEYDAKLAAKCMIAHFQHKLDLFGLEKLAKPITWDDLSADDRAALLSGFAQILPQKDRSGRTIIFYTDQLLDYKHINNLLRGLWYLALSKLESDEEDQKNGFIFIRYIVDVHDSLIIKRGLEYSLKSAAFRHSLPLKASAYHFCYNSEALHTVLGSIQMTIGTKYRIRFRIHFGSRLEVLYELMAYGISMNFLPVDTQGNTNVTIVKNMVHSFRQREEEHMAMSRASLATRPYLLLPRKEDILLGRGKPFQEFPGNVRLSSWIEEQAEDYKQVRKRPEKMAFIDQMLQRVKQSSGRFLKKQQPAPTDETNVNENNTNDSAKSVSSSSYSYWVEVEDSVAREKISHAFRTKPRKINYATALSHFFYGKGDGIEMEKQSSRMEANDDRNNAWATIVTSMDSTSSSPPPTTTTTPSRTSPSESQKATNFSATTELSPGHSPDQRSKRPRIIA